VSDELWALARDRPARTGELHPFNAFYGHDVVLKRYAGIPERRPLKAAVEHGFVIDDVVAELDRRIRLPLYLCQSPRRAEVLARGLPGVRVVPIGPLVHYARALHPAPERPASPARRVVLFPAHSTHSVRSRYDVERLLSLTEAWRASFDETVVCLYWRDVLAGAAETYRSRGLRCVTAGHMHDPRFLFRLLDVLDDASAVVSNEPGTHVAYAVTLGIPVWLVPEPVEYDAPDAAADQREALEDPGGHERRSLLFALFAEPRQALSDRQRLVVDDLVGASFVRSPEVLRELLEDAERRFRRLPLRRRAALRAAAAARAVRARSQSRT
jgi:hypothetical protein